MAILSCIAVVIEYAETMLFPAIPNIIRDFKITYDTSSWILSGYLITAAVMAPIAGKLSDMYGKKKVLFIIMTIFIISIAAVGFSINISFLILSRVIQGMGISMFIIALSILQSEVPKEKYALANGILASLYFNGSSIGLILGGGIVHYFDWRVTFFSLIPILGIIYVVVVKVLKVEEQKKHAFGSKMLDSPSSDIDTADASNNKGKNENSSSILPKNKIDIKGALALASGITFLLIALTYLEIGESSRSVSTSANFGICLVLLVVSAISIILFIRFEKTSASPLIDLSLVTNRTILPVVITFMMMGLTMFMVYQTVKVFVMAPPPIGFGGNALTSSIMLLPFTIIFLGLSPAVSKIIAKFGNLTPFIVASLISFFGFLGIYIFHANEIQVGVNLGVISVGLTLINTIAMNIILLLTPKQFGGVLNGVVQVFTFTGMALGPVIIVLYMQSFQTTIPGKQGELPFPSDQAYDFIFLLLPWHHLYS